MEKVKNGNAIEIEGASSDEEQIEMIKGTDEEAKQSEFLQMQNQHMLEINSQVNQMGLSSKATIMEKRGLQGIKPKLSPFSGNLLKKSPKWISGWQQRYVVLANKKLKYFKTP